MSRKHTTRVRELDVDMTKMYIIDRPTPLSEVMQGDLDDDTRLKAQRLLERRRYVHDF